MVTFAIQSCSAAPARLGSAGLGWARRSSVSLGSAESITLNASPSATCVCAAVRLADGSTLQLLAERAELLVGLGF